MRTILLLSLLVGCSSDESGGDDDTASSGPLDTHTDSSSSGDTDPVDVPDDTHGAVPSVALEAPEFAATNRDGGARDREDLLGHPTIMWFYPAAGTYG